MPFALPPTCWRHVDVSIFGASSMIYHIITSQSIPFLNIRSPPNYYSNMDYLYNLGKKKEKEKSIITHDAIQVL